MRSISTFVIVVGLILAATGIGVWAASRTTNHAKAGAKAVNVEDTREGVPVGGGLFVMPPVFSGAGDRGTLRHREVQKDARQST